MTFYCTRIQTPTHPTQVPGEFLHINNQRAHNNYENIILKEPNENPQRALLGPRAPLWTTLYYNILVLLYYTTIREFSLSLSLAQAERVRPEGGARSERAAPVSAARHVHVARLAARLRERPGRPAATGARQVVPRAREQVRSATAHSTLYSHSVTLYDYT